jgi:hypothetical protein
MTTNIGSFTSGTSINRSIDCKKMATASARRIEALKNAPTTSERFMAKVNPGRCHSQLGRGRQSGHIGKNVGDKGLTCLLLAASWA